MRAVLSVITIMLTLPGSKLSAQAPIPNGARVRISTPAFVLDHREGFLAADHVLILDRDRSVAVPLAALTKLERRAKKSNATAGGLVGLIVGLVAGSVTGTYAGLKASECESNVVNGRCMSGGAAVSDPIGLTGGAWGSVVGGVLGAAIGAAIGASVRTERWEEVPLDQLSVSFAPKRDGGFAFGLSVSF